MKRLLAALSLALVTGVGHAAIIKFTAILDGASENPPNASTGSGFATVTYDDVLQTLRVQVSFFDLVSPTTVAHIHCCVAAPSNVGVAVTPVTFPGFPVGVTSGTYDNTFNLTLSATYTAAFVSNFGGGTVAGAELALVQGMTNGLAYVNVHSEQFPAGEIRGFLAVPEPGTLALLGLAALGAFSFGRRKSR
jgi:hypothetical protein